MPHDNGGKAGLMQPRAKEGLGPPTAGRGRKGCAPEPLEGVWPSCRTSGL